MQICDTAAELGMDLVPSNAWPELLPFLFQCTQHAEPRMVEAGLLIFAQLSGYATCSCAAQYRTCERAASVPEPKLGVVEQSGRACCPVQTNNLSLCLACCSICRVLRPAQSAAGR